MPEDTTVNVGNRIAGEIVLVADVAKLIRPQLDYDKRKTHSYYLDLEGARELVYSLNQEHHHMATIQRRKAIRLDTGQYLLLDLHVQMSFEVTELPAPQSKPS